MSDCPWTSLLTLNWSSSLANTVKLWLCWEAPKCKCNLHSAACNGILETLEVKNYSLTLGAGGRVVLCNSAVRDCENKQNAPWLWWNSEREKVGHLFNRSSLLLLTARLDKMVASLATSQTAEGGAACLPRADNVKQVEATVSPHCSWLGVLTESLEGFHMFRL